MQKRTGRVWHYAIFITAISFLAILGSGCTGDTTNALATASEDPTTIVLKPRTFTLSAYGQPLLKLTGDVCQVRIQTGNTPHIVVQVAVRHYQNNSMPTINYNQSSDKGMVTINEKLSLRPILNAVNDSVIMTITVPAHIDLFLNTKIGNVDVFNVNGQFVLATSTGNISVMHAQLNKLSSLTANVGNVSFAGRLLTQGTYRMETRIGRISLAFQKPPSLQLDAQTMIGSIHSNFSDLAVDGNIAQGTLGKPPYAHLSLTARIGSISVLSQ